VAIPGRVRKKENFYEKLHPWVNLLETEWGEWRIFDRTEGEEGRRGKVRGAFEKRGIKKTGNQSGGELLLKCTELRVGEGVN